MQDNSKPGRDALVFAGAIVAVLAVKAFTLAEFWHDRLGDYSRLEGFADIILASSAWLHDAGISRESLPPELWKTPGYPLLIAGAKLALGHSWPAGLMILASVLSFVAGLVVRRFVLALGLGATAASLAFVLFEFSVPASTDVLLMPDGLYGSLATIALCWIGARFVAGQEVSLGHMAIGGALIGLCFFIREGFIYLVLPLGLALSVPLWLSGVPARRAALMLVVVCLPTLVAAAGIMTWNRYRTGDYVLAMVSETVFLIASLKAAEKDAGVFAGTGVLDRTARASLSDYDYGDAQKITERLFREHGLTAPALYRLARQKYIETVVHHPRAYVLSMLDRFRFAQQASLVGDLLMRLDDLAYWRYVDYHVDYYGGWRATARMLKDTWDMRLLTPALAMKIVPRVLTRAASIVLFLSFVVVLPVLLWRDLSGPGPARRRQAVFLASLYALYWAVFGIHLLVSVEMRYLGLICSIPIVGAIVVVRRLLRGGRPAAEVRAR